MTTTPTPARYAAGRQTVSVVIPVKNDSGMLAQCLGALGAQTRPADEIIVVDNGSSDGSDTVATAAGATVVRCAEPGIPAASARGYDRATGDLILRLDADCLPSDEWVRSVADAFAAHAEVAVFTGGARFVDGPARLRTAAATIYLLGYAAATAPALGHLPVFGSNLAMRRDAWADVRSAVHRADPRLHDDLDLAFHLGERHRIRYLRGMTMGMSMRPFADARLFRRRISRGFRTVLAHWPRDFPPVRWCRLLLCRARRALRAGAAAR